MARQSKKKGGAKKTLFILIVFLALIVIFLCSFWVTGILLRKNSEVGSGWYDGDGNRTAASAVPDSGRSNFYSNEDDDDGDDIKAASPTKAPLASTQTPAPANNPSEGVKATPKPTEVSKPTQAPKPTVAPKPTDTPKPTAAPKPTPAPTEAPKPTKTPIKPVAPGAEAAQ